MVTRKRLSLALSLTATVFAAGLVRPPLALADDIEVFFSTDADSSSTPRPR